MKKCLICEKYHFIETDNLSYTKGKLQIPQYSSVLQISDENTEFLFTIKYCPYCGKKLKAGK